MPFNAPRNYYNKGFATLRSFLKFQNEDIQSGWLHLKEIIINLTQMKCYTGRFKIVRELIVGVKKEKSSYVQKRFVFKLLSIFNIQYFALISALRVK